MADSTRDIWEDSEWRKRRSADTVRAKRYEGKDLDVTEQRLERKTGSEVRRYPLDMKLDKLACDLHRDLCRGTPSSDDPLIVVASVGRAPDAKRAVLLETIINAGVWVPSQGGTLLQEALLAMNIYGATALRLAWEPRNADLPYRLAVRLVKRPGYVKPIWDPQSPWRMLECWFGFEIDPGVAEAKYGHVTSGGRQPLYMEHWTPSTWRVTIDDEVPEMDGARLEGENTWGFVPFYYVPHERTTSLLGDACPDEGHELGMEINARAAKLADVIGAIRPGTVTARDISAKPTAKHVVLEDGTTLQYVNIGRTKAVSGAQPPTLAPFPVPDIPAELANFPQELLAFWQMVERISPASFGLDDTQSGRITGPAVETRMWTSMAHAITERINMTTAKSILDRDILRIVSGAQQAGLYDAMEDVVIEGEIGPIGHDVTIRQVWPPMLPMDRASLHDEWIERLRDGGASIELYLEAMHVQDVPGERERIVAWAEEQVRIEHMFDQQRDEKDGKRKQGDQRAE